MPARRMGTPALCLLCVLKSFRSFIGILFKLSIPMIANWDDMAPPNLTATKNQITSGGEASREYIKNISFLPRYIITHIRSVQLIYLDSEPSHINERSANLIYSITSRRFTCASISSRFILLSR